MPQRFGDIFIFTQSIDGPGRSIQYFDCYFLKEVGDFSTRQHVDKVIYDIDSLTLFVIEHEKSDEKAGPFCLTTINTKRKD